MNTFRAIVAWEVRFYLRRISTWVYFAIFFSIALLFMSVAAGAFGDIQVALGSGGKVMANAPFALSALLPTLALLGVSIIAALSGNALYKDYEVHAEPLFYTCPVTKAQFFGGRFVGSLIVNLIVVSGVGVGAFAATIAPWVQHDKIGAFRILSYLQPYLGLVIPNLLLTAAIFFALVSLTRQMLPNYVGGAVLLIGYLLAGTLFNDIENKRLAALVDPFGLRAQSVLTQYWSIAEKNERLVPISGILLENRLLWLGVAALILAIAYLRFRFAYALGDSGAAADAPEGAQASAAAVSHVEEPARAELLTAPVRMAALPETTQRFDARARWVQFRAIFARSFGRIVRSRYFGVIVGTGLLYLVIVARTSGRLFGTTTWPVTGQVETLLSGSFALFLVVIIAFYSGELVWAERDAGLGQLYDATPVTDAITLLAKFSAMGATLIVLLALVLLAGVATQAARGYYNFELPVYLQGLFGFQLVDWLLLAALAFAVHVVVNHKYLGHLIIILLFLGVAILPGLGLENRLYLYGSDSGYSYSDMNGWGPYPGPFVWWKRYWGSVAALLLVGCVLLWARGADADIDARLRRARDGFHGRIRALAGILAAGAVGMGGFIYYNTNILNSYRSEIAERHLRAERETRYKRYATVPQPRIVAVRVAVDFTPGRRSAAIDGQYVLRNKTAVPIDSIHLGIGEELDIRKLDFDRGATRLLADKPREYYVYRLDRPLAPGDSMLMRFTLDRIHRGFANEIDDHAVAANGTFLENAAFMPTIGYDARLEISDPDARKKEHLPAKPRMRPPTDSATWANSYISHDADWIRYDATVSTDTNQLAITSGVLQREWVQNGRRYFHYVMEAPILDLWAFQSARYAVRRDRWHDVDLEIDYQPTHAYNVERMIDAMKKALDYYTTNFGPYQYHQLRIVEFPRYAAFAQSLPNEIPFSEAIGFIARVESPTDVDYPFYVTAHEVAHQWWAHQVIGADAAGSTMLSETLAQYSALMVMEKEFGPAAMRRFLEDELNSYLIGRATEREKEAPLELVENQPYIHYNKGSLVMYALRDYIGEAKMNGAVRGFLRATKMRGPPYPTSLELVDSLRAATPDSLKYLISDLFEHITLYELRTDSVIARPAPGGKVAVSLYVNAKKLRADSLGAETEQPLNDWIDIGLFAKAPAIPDPKIDDKVGVPVYLQKHRIRAGAQTITVLADSVPYRAGIDPLHKLIDRVTVDNTIGVINRVSATRAPAGRARPATPGRPAHAPPG